MKVSYVVTLNASELKSIKRVLAEIAPDEAITKGEIKITQRSKLSSMMVKAKLKRTARIEMEVEISEEYTEWYADTVERLAPLIRGLIPQLINIGEEATKCAGRLPQDTDQVTETEGV